MTDPLHKIAHSAHKNAVQSPPDSEICNGHKRAKKIDKPFIIMVRYPKANFLRDHNWHREFGRGYKTREIAEKVVQLRQRQWIKNVAEYKVINRVNADNN
jgi:hypothetical protein